MASTIVKSFKKHKDYDFFKVAAWLRSRFQPDKLRYHQVVCHVKLDSGGEDSAGVQPKNNKSTS